MRSLFIPLGAVLLASLLTLSSISPRLFALQLLWLGLGVVLVVVFTKIDWRAVFNYRWLIWGLYGISVILLVAVLFSAPIIRNTRSWFSVGPFGFQPVELAKVALILMYAQYFSRRHIMIARWKYIVTSFVFFAIPAALTAVQPDLGSALILFGIWFGFLLVSGLPRRRLLATLLVLLVAGVWGWYFALEGYQRARIRGVFYPEENALTVNYSVIQSKIAIGSAGLLGKGWKQGTQTQLGFLTEPANDFILSAFIEEWGLLAGFLLVGAFLFLIYGVLRAGLFADQNFEKFICLGTALVYGIEFLLNAASTVGLFPVVGVNAPFLSYGGSSLLTSFFLLAIVNAIAKRS